MTAPLVRDDPAEWLPTLIRDVTCPTCQQRTLVGPSGVCPWCGRNVDDEAPA